MKIIFDSVNFFLRIIEFLILARCIMSWIVFLGSTNSFCDLVYDLTEIFLAPIRNILNKIGLKTNLIDISPIIACFLIELLKRFFAYIFY